MSFEIGNCFVHGKSFHARLVDDGELSFICIECAVEETRLNQKLTNLIHETETLNAPFDCD